jgi:hypothetical protein
MTNLEVILIYLHERIEETLISFVDEKAENPK